MTTWNKKAYRNYVIATINRHQDNSFKHNNCVSCSMVVSTADKLDSLFKPLLHFFLFEPYLKFCGIFRTSYCFIFIKDF